MSDLAVLLPSVFPEIDDEPVLLRRVDYEIESLEFGSPFEMVVTSGAGVTAIFFAIRLLQVIRDWKSERAIRTAEARIAQAQADLFEQFVHYAIEHVADFRDLTEESLRQIMLTIPPQFDAAGRPLSERERAISEKSPESIIEAIDHLPDFDVSD